MTDDTLDIKSHPLFRMVFLLLCLSVFVFSACSTTPELPVNKLKRQLKDVPNYSILLIDMREEGMFSKQYYHKYRVIQEPEAWETDWEEVSKNYYMANENFMGMALVSKVDGVVDPNVAPPGYNYVGNPQYGRWRDDGHGGSFWEFYGKYAFFSHLFGGWYRPVYRTDYNMYRNYRTQGRTYYGRNNEFGSSGNIVKQKKPNFYQRKMAKTSASKKTFSDKVSKRIGRTKTSYRSRSGSWGK